MESVTYRPIGVIRSPFTTRDNMPIQPTGAVGVAGELQILPEFGDGLKDLDGFSHLFLLYHFHLTQETRLRVTPFLDTVLRGVFATRAPNHPNPIGLSVVRLTGRDGLRLFIEDIDIVDGTPLLDIKPYVPEFDHRDPVSIGWMARARSRASHQRSDKRFR